MPSTQPIIFTEAELKEIKDEALQALSELSLTPSEAEALIAVLTIDEQDELRDFTKKFLFHVYGLTMMPVITDRAKIKKYLLDNINFRPNATTPQEIEQAKMIAQQFIVDAQLDLIIELQDSNLPAESFLAKQLAKVAAAQTNGSNSEVPDTDLTIRKMGIMVTMFGENIQNFLIPDARVYLTRMKTAKGILNVRSDLRRLVHGYPEKNIESLIKTTIPRKLEDFALAIKVAPVFTTQAELYKHIIDNFELPLDLTTNQQYLAKQIISKYVTPEYIRKMFLTSSLTKPPIGESFIAQSCSSGMILDSSVTLFDVAKAVKALMNNLFFTFVEAQEYVRKLSSADEILKLPEISLNVRLGIMSRKALGWMIDIQHFDDDLVRDSVHYIAERWPLALTVENADQLKELQKELIKERFLTTLAKVPKTSYRETVGATLAYIQEDLEIQVRKIDRDLVDIYNGKPLPDRRHPMVRAQEYVYQSAVTAVGNVAKSISFYTLKAGNYFFSAAKTANVTPEVVNEATNKPGM